MPMFFPEITAKESKFAKLFHLIQVNVYIIDFRFFRLSFISKESRSQIQREAIFEESR